MFAYEILCDNDQNSACAPVIGFSFGLLYDILFSIDASIPEESKRDNSSLL